MIKAELVTALQKGDPDDGDAGRRRRGLAIAATEGNIRPDQMGYKVPSQSGSGVYFVSPDDDYCSCPDFEERGRACKHIYAVEAIRGEAPPQVPLDLYKPAFAQPWATYDQAQVQEGDLFPMMLRQLCDGLSDPPQRKGRPSLPMGDIVFGLGMKVYSTLSTRRAMSHIRREAGLGRISREACPHTFIKHFGREEITPVLRHLIRMSALPLRKVERDFAIDSSGLASTSYNRWHDHKYGAKKKAKWVKLHIMCGVRTNIVTAADATANMAADVRFLPDFVGLTAEHFKVRDVSADKAYLSRKNLQAVEDAGGTAYIPFRVGSVAHSKAHPEEGLWSQMYHMFTLNRAEFDKHYHQRSNVEATFSVIKRKFGESTRAKTDTARVNEALVKVLSHNICVVIRTMHTLGITPVFDQEEEIRAAA